ncbi:MAG TPA: response regulator [Roseiflexaceae bacterium]|nr:response regulator [Roseiflexaceae bacterium]
MPTNILVVDDHQQYRDIFCKLLQACRPDLQIIPVETGSQTLNLSAQIAFDLLILDYHLQAMTAGDILRHLRVRARTSTWPLPPVVLTSAHPDAEVFARSLRVDAFLPKPVEYDELRDVLNSLLPTTRPLTRALGAREAVAVE